MRVESRVLSRIYANACLARTQALAVNYQGWGCNERMEAGVGRNDTGRPDLACGIVPIY